MVKIIATDPLAEGDFKHYCEESKFEYLGATKHKNKIHIHYKYKKHSN